MTRSIPGPRTLFIRFVHGRVRPLLGLCVCVASLGFVAAPLHAAIVLNEVAPHIDRLDDPDLLDEDGTASGFIELFNGGDDLVDLGGWALRADQGTLGDWTLPAVSLPAGEVLRIWTSGKNRSDPAQPLHADFLLAEAELLTLLDAGAGFVDEVPLAVPTDHSYGRCGSDWYYFDPPTPGALNAAMGQVPVVTLPGRLSLTVGRPHQLVSLPFQDPSWSSNDPKLSLLSSGELVATQDASSGDTESNVEVWSATVGASASVAVTIVNWTANLSSLKELPTPNADKVLGADDLGVYFTRGGDLYRSNDGMKTDLLVGPLPAGPGGSAQLHSTPFGWVYATGASVYHSPDLSTWSHAFTAPITRLRSGLSTHWDEATQTGTVLLAEYSTDAAHRHAVHRGTFDPSGASSWQTAVEFSSLDELVADPTLLDAARHIHVAAIDPYTGEAWIGTGDSSLHARILVGAAGGELDVLGMGDQSWRTLAIWFSPTHVYWNMDTASSQSVWRVPRSQRDPQTGWPSITPELADGATTPGLEYLVLADDSGSRFPVAVGEVWTETSPRPLDVQHRVRALDDPSFDYRERVAELSTGAHWFQMWAQDAAGDPISIMATSLEGAWRDDLARIFGFKERADGTVDVQELLAIESSPYYSAYAQLEPITQGPEGHLYFGGRMTAKSVYQMRLDWVDDDGAPFGEPTGGPNAAANAVVPPSPEMCVVSVPEPSVALGLLASAPLLARLARRRSRRHAPR